MKKISKAEFVRHAVANGLANPTVLHRTLEEVAKIVEGATPDMTIEKNKCEKHSRGLKRWVRNEAWSYLDLNKEETIYSFPSGFFVVYSKESDNSERCLVYL